MPILAKLLLGFLSVAVVTGLLGLQAYHGITGLGRLAMETYDKPLMAINFARAAETDFTKLHHQNPAFGLYLLRLVATRLLEGVETRPEAYRRISPLERKRRGD